MDIEGMEEEDFQRDLEDEIPYPCRSRETSVFLSCLTAAS
jgi:hypothetical protein